MTEPDNTPTEETTPEAPETAEPTPTEIAPDVSENPQPVQEDNPSELPAGPVSASPDPDAVSDEDKVNPVHEEDDNPESNVGDVVESDE